MIPIKKENRGEKKKKKWKELDIKIIQIREIQYMDNKCPRRKKNRKRSVQGWTRRKLEKDKEEKEKEKGNRMN